MGIYILASKKICVHGLKYIACKKHGLSTLCAVEDILDKASIPFQKVLFGEIHLIDELSREQKENLSEKLKNVGFELIDNHLSGLIEKIKLLVMQKARNEVDKKEIKLNLSVYLSEKLNYEYTHLSSLFSSVEGRTIENFLFISGLKRQRNCSFTGHQPFPKSPLNLTTAARHTYLPSSKKQRASPLLTSRK